MLNHKGLSSCCIPSIRGQGSGNTALLQECDLRLSLSVWYSISCYYDILIFCFVERIFLINLKTNQITNQHNLKLNITHPKIQSEIMLTLSFQQPSSVFRDRVQTSSVRALPIIMHICQKRDIIMCILQNNAYSPICIIIESIHYYTCFTH